MTHLPSNDHARAWDQFVLQHPRAHFLQLSAWGQQKSAYGWRARRVTLPDDDEASITAGAQILFRPLPLKLGTMAYVPYGGYVTDEAQWPALWEAIHRCAKSTGAAFLKWEPGLFFGHDPAQWGFHPSPQRVQPPRTILLDITASDEAIQQRMNQGTRRNIRKAYKNDVRYFQAAPEDLPRFTELMQITGERNDFGVHEPGYFERMYELFVPDHAVLLLAEHEGELLAINFVMGVGETAVYLEGASSNHKRNLMATYGVQWEAIQWAKERGLRYYDLWGVPDEDPDTLEAQFQERSDGLWGVYRFKRGWGGEVVRSAGTWDYVYNRFVYSAYRAALKVRG